MQLTVSSFLLKDGVKAKLPKLKQEKKEGPVQYESHKQRKASHVNIYNQILSLCMIILTPVLVPARSKA
jgi:hypothetical protein